MSFWVGENGIFRLELLLMFRRFVIKEKEKKRTGNSTNV
jgi:hypothetical protein